MSAATPGTGASHVVVSSPNKPRPTDRWALAIANAIRQTENNYHREGSGPGSRFEGELLEDVQARVAISFMLARQAEESGTTELRARLRAVLLDLSVTAVEARIQALHLLDEAGQ